MEKYIGCSGFFYWDWRGRFYPENLKPSKWFEYYSSKFNTVEINSTFYHFPKENSLKKWYKLAPEYFLFSLKANKTITHIKKFKNASKDIENFYKVALVLGDKLGCILFQMPPSFKYSSENLSLIIDNLNSEFCNVVEFRDSSWWNKEVYKTFKEHNIVFCSVSAPNLPDEVIKTSQTIYIRFHGKESWYKYKYAKEELLDKANTLKNLNPQKLFAYFNNTYRAYAPLNALEFILLNS